jgi:hypothetical protein
MPRYFFHFTDGRQKFTDTTGVVLPSIGAMRQHAAQQIHELCGVMPAETLQNWLGWKIIAVDSVGNTVYEIGFDFTWRFWSPNRIKTRQEKPTRA